MKPLVRPHTTPAGAFLRIKGIVRLSSLPPFTSVKRTLHYSEIARNTFVTIFVTFFKKQL